MRKEVLRVQQLNVSVIWTVSKAARPGATLFCWDGQAKYAMKFFVSRVKKQKRQTAPVSASAPWEKSVK